MPSKPPPRLLPTLALVVLWVAIYSLWVAVRPPTETTTTSTTRNNGATASSTTTTTFRPLFKFKP